MGSRALFKATLAAVATVIVLAEALQWSSSARFGAFVQNVGRCALRVVTSDTRTSELRVGDTIALGPLSTSARADIVYHYARTHPAPLGATIPLTIERAGATLTIPYRFVRDDSALVFFAQFGFKLVVLAIGLFVWWRGRARAAMWLGIWCTGIAIALPDGWCGGMPDSLRIFGVFLDNAIWTMLPFALYLVVESLITTVRKPVVWIARVAMALSILPALVVNVIDTTAQTFTGCALVGLGPTAVNSLFVGSQLIILAYFILGYAGTKGLDRLRLRWVFWAFVFSRVGVLLNLVNRLSTHPMNLSGVEWLTIVIFPLGCAYAILRHRLIDVNFVLNRTLVYTILTTIVVGLFVVVEHVLNVVAATRGVGLAIEIALALGIGVSFNLLHKRVEVALERTLFRSKYEAATRLTLLTEEAAYMESPDALLARVTTEIPEAIGANGAAVYERRDGAYRLAYAVGMRNLPQRVDADDPAFVRLRKQLTQVDLADLKSALGDDALAFAFAVRGQLMGAFICGRRKNAETYAPDEVAMIRRAVHEVGAELNAIRARERAELLSGLLSGRVDIGAARTAAP